MVGFSPRGLARDLDTGELRYLRWQHAWWNGEYSLVLSKAALLHRGHIEAFAPRLGSEMRKIIDELRNCEDIALAHMVAQQVIHIQAATRAHSHI